MVNYVTRLVATCEIRDNVISMILIDVMNENIIEGYVLTTKEAPIRTSTFVGEKNLAITAVTRHQLWLCLRRSKVAG